MEECSRDNSINCSGDEESEDEDVKLAIKTSLEECQIKSKENTNKKEGAEEKLTREMDYKYVGLSLNDYIITSKGIGKLTQPPKENNDDIGKTTFKIDYDETIESVTLENLNFSLFKSIKVIVVNYLDKIFQLNYVVNINEDFDSFKHSFCDSYFLNPNAVAIIYKNNKLNKKDMKKKFGKDFDYNNDYVTILQAKTLPCIEKIDGHIDPHRAENLLCKFIFTVNVPITCQNLYFFRSLYPDRKCKYFDFEIFMVNASIENFCKEEVKEVTVKKKGKNKDVKESSDSQYNFDKIFKNSDKYDLISIKTIESINADNNESRYDSDDETYSDNSKSNKSDERDKILKKMAELSMDNITFLPETIYYVKYKVNVDRYDHILAVNFKSDRFKKFKMKNNFEISFHLPNNDKSKNYLYLGGIGYTVQTIFEKDE